MKILQLCHKPPSPPKDGGCIAMNNLTKGLINAGHQVKVLTIETSKHPLELEKLSKEHIENTQIESVFINTSLNLVDAFSNMITQDSYNIMRFFSPDFDRKLIKILKANTFDIIHFESLFVTPYIATVKRFSEAKIVMRSHNIEHLILKRMAKQASKGIKKTYLKLLSKQLKKYEVDIANTVDGIASISAIDEVKFKGLGVLTPITTIKFGLELEQYTPKNKNTTNEINLFHLGAMDWMPNREGVFWFLSTIWEKVLKKYPDMKLILAGKAIHKTDYNFKNVEVVGKVENAIDFINEQSIMIVPLLSGSGVRVKIIEGMALGKTIISTNMGAQGIDHKHKTNILIANDTETFIDAVEQAIKDLKGDQSIGQNARALVENHHNNTIITQKLIEFYQYLIDRKTQS